MHHAQSHNIELNVEIRSICYSFSGHKLLLLIDVLLEVRIECFIAHQGFQCRDRKGVQGAQGA